MADLDPETRKALEDILHDIKHISGLMTMAPEPLKALAITGLFILQGKVSYLLDPKS